MAIEKPNPIPSTCHAGVPGLTRRVALTLAAGTAAASAATALAATKALGAAGPDPIFAAIERHRRAYAEWTAACMQLDEAEEATGEHSPSTLVNWRDYCIGSSEIDDMRDRLLRQPDADAAQIEREYAHAKAKERKAQQAERDWYERHGLTPMQKRCEGLRAEMHDAEERMSQLKPTTAAGVAAILSYMLDDVADYDSLQGWPAVALETAVEALNDIAVAS